MHQRLPRPYPLLARLIIIVLAVIIMPLLSGVLVQAEQPKLADRQNKDEKLAEKPTAAVTLQPGQETTQPRVTVRIPSSRAAGAYWAEPWKERGPIVLDTHRPAPPTIEVRRPPALSGSERLETSRTTTPPPALNANEFDRDRYIRQLERNRAWEFYRYGQFYPQTFGTFERFGDGRFLWGIPAGRGYISSGRGFHGGRFGFHGGGFRGGGFRGR